MAKVVIVGSINQDIVFELDSLPSSGQTLLAKKSSYMYGGKGANQAVSCASLGADCSLIAKIGNDAFGKAYLVHLIGKNVNIEGVIVSNIDKTGLAVIYVDNTANNSIVVSKNANDTLTSEDIITKKEIFNDAKYILIQNEILHQTNLNLIKEFGEKIIYDPAPAKIVKKEYLRCVYAITPNEKEALELVDEKGLTIYQAGLKLNKLGINHVLITLGEKGVLHFTNQEIYKYDSYKVSSIDTTGAGDTFNGALAAFLSEGTQMKLAITKAQAAAALSTKSIGAQTSMPSEYELNDFINSYGLIKRQRLR